MLLPIKVGLAVSAEREQPVRATYVNSKSMGQVSPKMRDTCRDGGGIALPCVLVQIGVRGVL
jgi:hypothetical protein